VTTTLRCAVLDDYQGVALSMADWSPVADRVEVTAFTEHRADSEELVAALADVDIVVVMRERTPLPALVFAGLPRLRLVVTAGMRNSAIDLPAAAHGVLVCGTASSPVPPTELTWALILGLARNLAAENAAFHAGGRWQSTVGVELGVTLAPSLVELLATSDVVSIHLALGERTRGLLGRDELARMRPRRSWSTRPARRSSMVRRWSTPSCRAGSPVPASTCSTASRCHFREAVEDIAAFLAGTPIRTLS
jgi:phosphoglycerate dehydrogenase-like enzyme